MSSVIEDHRYKGRFICTKKKMDYMCAFCPAIATCDKSPIMNPKELS